MKYCLLIIIFFYFFSFLPLIQSQSTLCDGCDKTATTCTSSGTCDPKCRPKFSDSNNGCKYCTGSDYFYSYDQDGNCQTKESCGSGEIVVYDSKECVPLNTANCHILGDYCYTSAPSNAEIDSSTNKYKCKYKYYITYFSDTNIKEYHCLSNSDSCPITHPYYNYYSDDINQCVSSCGDYYYSDVDNNKCVSSCTTGFYNANKKCLDSPSECLYSQSEASLSNKRCYESCADIGGGYIYQKGSMCSNQDCSNYYADENSVKICFDSISACKAKEYIYYQNNKCLTECIGYKDGDESDTNLIYCFPSVSDCIEKNYKYYDLSSEKCYRSSCPNGYYPKYPSQNNGYECVNCANLKISNDFCKDNCEDGECFFIDDSNTNPNSINSNECKSILNNFYYIDNSSGTNKKICVDQCSLINKYYFLGDKKCIDKCKKTENGVDVYKYYDPADNQCVEQCSGTNLYAKKPTNDHEKCDTSCPVGYKYLVENNYQCIDACPEGSPYYFLDANNHFICKDSLTSICTGDANLFFNGQCVTASDCKTNERYRINSKNMCVLECEDGYDFIEKVIEGVYKCKKNCESNQYIINNNECVAECPKEFNYIGKNNKCKSICESIDGIRYYEYERKGDDYIIFKCLSSCPNEFQLELYDTSSDKRCYNKCPETYKYLYSNKCYNVCSEVTSAPYSLTYTDTDGNVQNKCSILCDSDSPNFEEDKICKSGCALPGRTIIDHDNKCVEKCDETSEYKYLLDNKCVDDCATPNNYVLNGKCVAPTACNTDTYKFNPIKKDSSETGAYECVLNCPNNYFKKYSDDRRICLDKCAQDEYAIIDTSECFSNCDISISSGDTSNTYHYYEPGTSYLINTCVKTCPSDKPYLEGNRCVNTCIPKFVEDNKCQVFCTNGKHYVNEFLSEDQDKEKECLDQCPPKYPYYKEQDNKKVCYYKCPDEFPYHIENEYECKTIEESASPNNFVDYEKKTFIQSCEGFKYIYEKKDDVDSTKIYYTICLNDCSLIDKYSTPENKCVDSCDENVNLELETESPKTCKCKYFFYKDISLPTPIIKCLDSDKNCNNIDTYNIQRINTKECLSTCPDILSLNGDYCITEESQCVPNEIDNPNTKVVTTSEGQKQCVCLNKFYINSDTNKKICLLLGQKCPGNYEYYIPSTKECINTCSTNKIFKNFCLDACPKGSTQSGSECTCSKYWYSISDTNFECLDACLPSHPYSIHDTSQCIPKCRNTDYPYLVNGECYSNCESFPNTISTNIQPFEKDYEFAEETCRCVNLWYFNTKTKSNVCPDDSNKKEFCKDFTEYDEKLNFLVKSTKQCVTSCPSDYPYSFNDECFHSCEEANSIFLYNVKQEGDSTICICNNLWKYETINDIKKKVCLDEANCPEHSLEIIDTRECQIFAEDKPLICPESSPLEFNNKCYKTDKCPTNTHYDSNKAGKCVCDNLWYIDEDSNKINCLNKDTDICIVEYPYLIYETKQCFKPDETKENKCSDEYPYEFNKICYKEECPELTKEKSNKICICDETKGKWYKYSPDDNNIYLYCGIDECPTENPNKPNLIENKNQCTFNCDEDSEENYIWSYKNLCYEECPEFTKENTYEKKCEFYKLKEAKDLQELNNYVSVQVKELYDSGPKGGYLFHNEESSLQIYPYNKLGDSPARDITKKSNLTFIDLNTCLSKIFEDQNLDEDDQIFVVKYDLLNDRKENQQQGEETEENAEEQNDNKNNKNTEHYLINEVEYEFYSSKTLERIDASVCEPKEIIISYPISYTLSKFDKSNDTSNLNSNEYRLKFNLGKDLNKKDNSIDTFNSNNSVYKELCMPLEINGKDLVLEQRYDILFPNNISLCEKNCTLFYTDYILERIYCKCDYKEVLDFNREMPIIADLFSDPNFAKTTQSGANVQIIKCISNLPNKDSIIKNEAFYYSTVILVGEITMIFIAGFYSIKLIKGNIYNLGRKNNGNNKGNKEENKNENIIATSNRLLNSNPPKKNNISINEDINKNNEEENPKEKRPYLIKKRTIFNLNRNTNEENSGNDIEIKDIDIYPKTNIENKFIEIKDIKGKAEFIPPEYNFKFFKKDDTGITKKIKRSEIPFQVNSTTKYLLEYKENINYAEDYLYGPIYLNQNMLEIIEDETQIENNKENDVNKKIVYKGNNNNIIETKREKIRTRSIKNEKSFITIKTINPLMKVSEVEYTEEYDYNVKQKIDESISLYYLIKREQTMLRIPYKIYIEKNHKNLLAIILAEIMDKIYIIKICCF